MTEHQRNMMFCVQVTLYTGLANVTMKWAPWLTPFLFGAVDLGFVVWLLAKERAIRHSVLGARVGFAFVSLLRSDRRRAEPVPLATTDQAWIMKTFDLDGDGKLSAKEIEAMLARQGIDLSAEETARILAAVDRDGDGLIDREELGAFLEDWFAGDPTYDDDLALAFRALDKNGDGQFDVGELREALRGRDGGIAAAEVEPLLEQIHAEKDGKIEWPEFARAVESKRRGWQQPWLATAEGEAKERLRAVTDAEVAARQLANSKARAAAGRKRPPRT